MDNYKPMFTSLAAHFQLSHESCPQSEQYIEKMSNVPYSSAFGNLMYAMVYTKHSYLTQLAWWATLCIILVRIVGRLWNESFVMWRPLLIKGWCLTETRLQSFLDSNYGGDPDRRRSISGYILLFLWVLYLEKHHFSLW